MRDAARIEPIIERLKSLWLKHPDLRLGQIIVNGTGVTGASSSYYIEDDQLINAIEIAHRSLTENPRRRSETIS